MKKQSSLLLWAACFFSAMSAVAMQFQSTDSYFLAEDQTVTNELWLFTSSAQMKGSVLDDLLICGSELALDGHLHGDLWALGDVIRLTGRAEAHARILGRTIEISGRTGRNLLAIGQSVWLTSDSAVGGDVVLLGKTVVVEGQVDGHARILAPQVTLNGRFAGDVQLNSEDIVVRPGTEVQGNLLYTSPHELILDQRVVVRGELIRTKPAEASFQRPSLNINQIVSLQVFLYLAALCVAAPFLALFPSFTGRAVRLLRNSTWKCALIGFVAFGLFPLVIFFAALTLIGLPLSLVLLSTFFLLLYLSKFVVALTLGSAILRVRGPQPFLRALATLGVGMVLLYALVNVPLLGAVFGLLMVWLGLGGLLMALLVPEPAETLRPPPLPQVSRPGPPPVPTSFPESPSLGGGKP